MIRTVGAAGLIQYLSCSINLARAGPAEDQHVGTRLDRLRRLEARFEVLRIVEKAPAIERSPALLLVGFLQ